MSWRERLQPASFRGVPFQVDSSAFGLGRRTQVHEYPGNDDHWAEDLGLGGNAKPITVQGYVLGDDYDQRREALIDALNQAEPGTLIHPRFGALEVVATSESRVQESAREGGIATFNLSFIRSGVRKYPQTTADSVAGVNSAVDTGLTSLTQAFNKAFTVTQLPGWLSDSATEALNEGLDILQPFVDSADSVSGLRTVFDNLRSQFTSLLNTPESLADQTLSAMAGLFAIDLNLGGGTSGISSALGMRSQLSEGMAGIDPVNVTTPTRQQQADNQQQISDLYSVGGTLLAVKAVAELSPAVAASVDDSPFDSYNHALVVRDELVTALDAIAETATDDVFGAVRDVRVQLARHIDAHGFSLARLAYHTPGTQLPALVLAHQLYGDAEREEEIILRNNVRHPAFVPAGVALELLAEVGSA